MHAKLKKRKNKLHIFIYLNLELNPSEKLELIRFFLFLSSMLQKIIKYVLLFKNSSHKNLYLVLF